MNLQLFNMPTDEIQLPVWLEHRVMSPLLGEFVAELLAIHPSQPSRPTLDDVLKDHREEVLQTGLVTLSRDQLRQLLVQPLLLLELQERVLVQGGAYWQVLPPEPMGDKANSEIVTTTPSGDTGENPSNISSRGVWRAVMALAASIVVVIGIMQFFSYRGPDWNQPVAVLRNAKTENEAFQQLASAARSARGTLPSKDAELQAWIKQFRSGCGELIVALDAGAGPLLGVRRLELRQRCQAWAEQLDQALTDLRAGRPPSEVRTDVLGTVDRLLNYLDQASSS